MSTIRITTTQNIELEYDLASLGDRILGRLLDLVFQVAYGLILVMILAFATDGMSSFASDTAQRTFMILLVVLIVLPIMFYDLVCEIFMNGQSPGKKIMKIKVISLNGEQPTLGQYMIRWLFRIVDFSFSYNLCALLCVAINENHQRLGDIVAGTTLIKTTPRTNFSQTLYMPIAPEIAYNVSFPEVVQLSDADVQLLKEVILSVQKTGNSMLAYQAAEKVKAKLNIQSNLTPIHFLNVVVADYNHLTANM